LNNALDSLASILYTIDPTMECAYMSKHETGEQSPPKKKIKSDADTNIANRVDLINYSVNVLKRVNEENEARKLLIAELLHGSSNVRGTSTALEQGPSQRNSADAPPVFNREGIILRNDLARIANAYNRLGTSILDNSNSISGHNPNVGLQSLSSFSTIPGSASIRNTTQLPDLNQLKAASPNPYPVARGTMTSRSPLRPDTQDYISANTLSVPQNTRGFSHISETIAQQNLLNLLQSGRNQPFSSSPNTPISGNSNALIPPSQGIAESLLSSRLQPNIAALRHLVQQRNPSNVLQREAISEDLITRILSRRSETNSFAAKLHGDAHLGSKNSRGG